MSEQQFNVTWGIDVWARNEAEAANLALAIQRDRDSIATVFHVENEEGRLAVVDLTPDGPGTGIRVTFPRRST